VRKLRFRGIHSDEPDLFTIAQNDGFTVNNPGAFDAVGIGTGKGYEQEKQGEK